MSSVVRRMVVGECLWCSNKMCLTMNDWLVKNMNILNSSLYLGIYQRMSYFCVIIKKVNPYEETNSTTQAC